MEVDPISPRTVALCALADLYASYALRPDGADNERRDGVAARDVESFLTAQVAAPKAPAQCTLRRFEGDIFEFFSARDARFVADHVRGALERATSVDSLFELFSSLSEVCTSAADAAGEPSRLAFQGRAPLALFLRRTLLSFRKLAFAAVSRICDAVAWALADPAAPPPHAPAAIQRYADHSAHQLPHLLATHTPDELIASLPADATDAPRKRLLDALLQAENGEVEAAVDSVHAYFDHALRKGGPSFVATATPFADSASTAAIVNEVALLCQRHAPPDVEREAAARQQEQPGGQRRNGTQRHPAASTVPVPLPYAAIVLSSFLLAFGDLSAAERSAMEALKAAQARGDGIATAHAMAALARVHLALGSPQTTHLLRGALERARAMQMPHLAATVALLAANRALTVGTMGQGEPRGERSLLGLATRVLRGARRRAEEARRPLIDTDGAPVGGGGGDDAAESEDEDGETGEWEVPHPGAVTGAGTAAAARSVGAGGDAATDAPGPLPRMRPDTWWPALQPLASSALALAREVESDLPQQPAGHALPSQSLGAGVPLAGAHAVATADAGSAPARRPATEAGAVAAMLAAGPSPTLSVTEGDVRALRWEATLLRARALAVDGRRDGQLRALESNLGGALDSCALPRGVAGSQYLHCAAEAAEASAGAFLPHDPSHGPPRALRHLARAVRTAPALAPRCAAFQHRAWSTLARVHAGLGRVADAAAAVAHARTWIRAHGDSHTPDQLWCSAQLAGTVARTGQPGAALASSRILRRFAAAQGLEGLVCALDARALGWRGALGGDTQAWESLLAPAAAALARARAAGRVPEQALAAAHAARALLAAGAPARCIAVLDGVQALVVRAGDGDTVIATLRTRAEAWLALATGRVGRGDSSAAVQGLQHAIGRARGQPGGGRDPAEVVRAWQRHPLAQGVPAVAGSVPEGPWASQCFHLAARAAVAAATVAHHLCDAVALRDSLALAVLCFKQLGWSGLAEAWTARLAGVAGDLQEAAAATEPAPSLAASLADAVDDALQRVDTFRAEGMPSAV